MNVVHVVWSLADGAGGLSRAVVLIANAQARNGHSVRILTTRDPDETHRGLQALDPGIDVRFFERSGPARRWAGSRGLRAHLRHHVGRDDVVHVHSMWDLPAVLGARAARRSRARLVVSPHGSLEPHDLLKHAMAKKLLGPVFLRPLLGYGTVLCTTPREADSLTTYGARPTVRTLPLPVGDAPPAPRDPDGFRARCGLPQDVPLMLFLGRIDQKKGLGHVLRAMTQMRSPAHLVAVGAGEPAYERSMKQLAVDLGLEDRVTWTGWLEGADKADAFASADLFVLLSDAENYGIVVVEALQYGAIIAASSEVGAAAWLATTGAVVITPRGSPEASAGLDRALTDADLRRRTRQAATDVFDGALRPDEVARQYDQLVTSLRGAS